MGAKTSGRMRQVVALAFPRADDENGKMVVLDVDRMRVLGPFKDKKTAESWLSGREFVLEEGSWTLSEHDRPGDGAFWWGELDGKLVAVEIRELA